MNFSKLKELGKLEEIEIRSASFILGLIAVGMYTYRLIVNQINKNAIEIVAMRYFLAALFLGAALAPLTKRKTILENYGWFLFIPLLIYGHYLIYITSINNFSIENLLGAYMVIFGSFIIIRNQVLILVASTTHLIHTLIQVSTTEADPLTEKAVLLSMFTLFIFSFVVSNSVIRHKKQLKKINLDLERKVKQRTKDLENYSNELFEKNEDLENFAHVISHDLKSPLRNLHSIASWLTEDNGNNYDTQTTKSLEIIKEQVYQMDLLIDGVLSYSLYSQKVELKTKLDLNKFYYACKG